MSRNKFIVLSFVYGISLFFFTLYSYSQIDLNLTLSSNHLYQTIQQQLIYLGYYNRTISSAVYIFLLIIFFISYFLILHLVHKKKIAFKNIVGLIILSIIILFFAYPAFSHDIFNYIFDARIVTHYNLNPYDYKALDFPIDPWIRFMHWTHRQYPYGPVWLVITLPFSYLGLGKFVLTLASFKLMFTLFHIANIYLLYKIASEVNPNNSLTTITLYALNPLILIESILSPHNEVVMLFFLLLSIYFCLVKKNIFLSIASLFISAGVKFITIILLPVLIWQNKFKKDNQAINSLSIITLFLVIPSILEIIYREAYPWYFIILIGVGFLLASKRNIILLLQCISIGALLRYVPYLYYGEYSDWVKICQRFLFMIALFFSLIRVVLENFKRLFLRKQ